MKSRKIITSLTVGTERFFSLRAAEMLRAGRRSKKPITFSEKYSVRFLLVLCEI